MRLWTIQSRERWDELEAMGILLGPSEAGVDAGNLTAYRWMADQMARRLGPPPVIDRLPLWAWYRWLPDRPRPDLRASGHLPAGSRGVRIELEVGGGSALLSDFEAWHAVLNRHYLATSEADLDAFEADPKAEPSRGPGAARQRRRRMESSWERIFDLATPSYSTAPDPEDRSIQATLWEIHRDQVRRFTSFVAR